MNKLYRQDGSVVELNDADAQKWLALGLATTTPQKSSSVATKAVEPTPDRNPTSSVKTEN